MFDTVRRNARRAASLAFLLVLGVLTWPAANLQGQEKKEDRSDPPTKEQLKLLPPAPAPTTPQSVPPGVEVQPVPQPTPAVLLAPPGSGPGKPPPVDTGVFVPEGSRFNPQATNFAPTGLAIPAPRFPLTIDPKTPVKDLLPAAPKVKDFGPLVVEDLSRVPEVEFQAPVVKDANAMQKTAHTIARINHLNVKKADGFLEALRDERRDLNGLPFAMGDACRTKGERNRQFAAAVTTVRAFVQQGGGNADAFWTQYVQNCAQGDAALGRIDRAMQEHATLARVAALMQILAPETPSMRIGLVKYLSTVSHAEATRALARLAIFSAEDEVRQAATDALKVRRERDYSDILLQGMRYPWPAVAKRAGEVIVKLERNDLIPQLVDLLDEPDPRSPVMKEVEKKKVPVVRELVRINHHRNCLLCHAPGNTDTVSAETLTVAVPTPDQPLSPPSGGYGTPSSPDLLVRLDVTYLRQDFSLLQPVADAAPWPEMQRFDFLVRTRTLTEEEADAYRDRFDKRERGRITPYQRAAVTALRELTGKDTAPTSAAWRELLDLPERKGSY